MTQTEYVKLAVSTTLKQLMERYRLDPQEVAGEIHCMVEHLRMIRDKSSTYLMLKTAYKMVDDIMQTKGRHPEQGVEISCRKGCHFCCRMWVDISPVEAEGVLKYAKEKKIQIDKAYLKKQSKISKEEFPLHKDTKTCVFLTKEGLCSVYEMRPLACRKYVVVTPAELCDDNTYPKGMVASYADIQVEIIVSAITTLDQAVVPFHKELYKKL